MCERRLMKRVQCVRHFEPRHVRRDASIAINKALRQCAPLQLDRLLQPINDVPW